MRKRKSYSFDVVCFLGFWGAVIATFALLAWLIAKFRASTGFWCVVAAVVVLLVLARRLLKARELKALERQGVDYLVESVEDVGKLLEAGGRPRPMNVADDWHVHEDIAKFVGEYASVRLPKRGRIFSRKDFLQMRLSYRDETYRVLSDEGETAFCVKEDVNDPKVYVMYLELSPRPLPYASDLVHYVAMRAADKDNGRD